MLRKWPHNTSSKGRDQVDLTYDPAKKMWGMEEARMYMEVLKATILKLSTVPNLVHNVEEDL